MTNILRDVSLLFATSLVFTISVESSAQFPSPSTVDPTNVQRPPLANSRSPFRTLQPMPSKHRVEARQLQPINVGRIGIDPLWVEKGGVCKGKAACWDVRLSNVAKRDGYFVSKVDLWCNREPCGRPCTRVTAPSPDALKKAGPPNVTFWEFSEVNRGEGMSNSRITSFCSRYFSLFNSAHLTNTRGCLFVRREIRFYCKRGADVPEGTGDAVGVEDGGATVPAAPIMFKLWRTPITSGAAPATKDKNKVRFWSKKPVIGPAFHWAKRAWHCCDSHAHIDEFDWRPKPKDWR